MSDKRPTKRLEADIEKLHPDILEAGRALLKDRGLRFKFKLGEPELVESARYIEHFILDQLRTIAAQYHQEDAVHRQRPTPRSALDGDTLVFWYENSKRGRRTGASKARMIMMNP